jgi:AraC-like DNA-binding protein
VSADTNEGARRNGLERSLPDVFSDLLERGEFRGDPADELAFTEEWSVPVAPGSACYCCAVEGNCQIELDGGEAVTLGPGDLAVTTRQNGCRLRNAPGNPGRLICGAFRFESPGMSLLLDHLLPPLVVVRECRGRALPWVEDLCRLLLRESASCGPGQRAVIDQLTRVLFLQALRTCFTSSPDAGGAWVAALTDPEIARALQLMHSRFSEPWTVASLAEQVCLSRSVFAARFKDLVMQSPLQYLLEFRMRKAAQLLLEGRREIKQIAAEVGYASRAAFSCAFKRWSGGASPGAYKWLRHDASGNGHSFR